MLGPKNSSQLIEESNVPPVNYDPSSGFFSGEDEVLVNTYQGLVEFNYTSITTFAPVLAISWSNSNTSSYSFVLRNNSWFANGHPVNSSVVWFSIYRAIIMNQVGASFFTNLLYNGTTAFATGYNVPKGLAAALLAAGYPLSTTNSTLQQIQAGQDLASILSNFNPANSTLQEIMNYSGQAIVVTGTYTVTFNLVNPYVNFVQVMASPPASMIDPAFVDAHGGVQAGKPADPYVATVTMGTGPYQVLPGGYITSQVLTMTANPNYWAARLPAADSNIMLTLPHIPVIIIEYASTTSQILQSIQSNLAQLITGSPIPAIAPFYLPSLASSPGIQVLSFPNAPKFNYLMSVLDTLKYPYNITQFRQSLAYAINYSEIYQTVSFSYGQPYLGPISPGFPYYNPANLPPYSYDANRSIQLLSNLGFKLTLPNGTILNPNGIFLSNLSISYINTDPAHVKIAQELQIMYENVGLFFTLNPLTVGEEFSDLFQAGTAASYPSYLLWYWFPSWVDSVYQELVVQVNPTYGGVFGDVSWFNNATVNNLTNTLPFLTNPTQINQTVTKVYSIIYQQVPDIWLYALVPYYVQRNYVTGLFYNPGILGNYYPLLQYTTS